MFTIVLRSFNPLVESTNRYLKSNLVDKEIKGQVIHGECRTQTTLDSIFINFVKH